MKREIIESGRWFPVADKLSLKLKGKHTFKLRVRKGMVEMMLV